MRAIKARGKTVVLTTHYMEEAYLLCDDIAIMDHGRVIARGSPQQLLADHFGDSVLELPAVAVADRPLDLPVLHSGDRVEIMSGDVDVTIRALQAAGVPLAQLRIRSRTLEDLFLELTGEALRA